jgi:hypothetical protein
MDSTYKAEAQLLYDVVDWFAEKYNSGNQMLVTYKAATMISRFLKHWGMIDVALPCQTPHYVRPQVFPEMLGFLKTNRITAWSSSD